MMQSTRLPIFAFLLRVPYAVTDVEFHTCLERNACSTVDDYLSYRWLWIDGKACYEFEPGVQTRTFQHFLRNAADPWIKFRGLQIHNDCAIYTHSTYIIQTEYQNRIRVGEMMGRRGVT